MTSEIPSWVTFPEDDWIKITPAKAGFDANKWQSYLANLDVRGADWHGEVHKENDWGAVLTRGGYLVHTWGDGDYKYQTASVGKALSWAILGLAVDRGLVRQDDYVWETWTGEGQLSHPHKRLDQGHHKRLTWRHLGERKDGVHWGGFPVTNGYFWRKGAASSRGNEPIPEWVNWTGDPSYDNYAHTEPGTVGMYSSGGIWRLAQALTALWDKDIKQVLDDELFCKMGIPAEDWDMMPGKAICEDRNWYPRMPGYGDFLDPPYEINGHVVRGGQWVVMSAKNLARYGLLIATGGIWKGRRIIKSRWVRGHSGGNGSIVAGDRNTFVATGIVTTVGLPSFESFSETERATRTFNPYNQLIVGPVAVTPDLKGGSTEK